MVTAALPMLLIAVLAIVGLVVPTAAAHAQAGTVVAVATAADDTHHVGSVDATVTDDAARTARRRAVRRRRGSQPRPAVSPGRRRTTWHMPARVVGGVPPGRAPPVAPTRPSGAQPAHA